MSAVGAVSVIIIVYMLFLIIGGVVWSVWVLWLKEDDPLGIYTHAKSGYEDRGSSYDGKNNIEYYDVQLMLATATYIPRGEATTSNTDYYSKVQCNFYLYNTTDGELTFYARLTEADYTLSQLMNLPASTSNIKENGTSGKGVEGHVLDKMLWTWKVPAKRNQRKNFYFWNYLGIDGTKHKKINFYQDYYDKDDSGTRYPTKLAISNPLYLHVYTMGNGIESHYQQELTPGTLRNEKYSNVVYTEYDLCDYFHCDADGKLKDCTQDDCD